MSISHQTGKIKAVIFDLDGTLYLSDPSGLEVFRNYALELGYTISSDMMNQAARWNHWYWASSSELSQDIKLEEEEFWVRYSERLLQAFGITESKRSLAERITGYFANYNPSYKLNDGVMSTLKNLDQAGYVLGIASNRRQPITDLVHHMRIDQYLSFSVVAGEMGAWKPDPRFFDLPLERSQCLAAEAVYVGDNYYADVIGASNAGLVPVLIDPDDVFEDVDCVVIRSLNQLVEWLSTGQDPTLIQNQF